MKGFFFFKHVTFLYVKAISCNDKNPHALKYMIYAIVDTKIACM